MDLLPTVETKLLAVSFGAKANPEERVLAVAADDGTVLACREAIWSAERPPRFQ